MILKEKYKMRIDETDKEYEARMESYHDSDGISWFEIAAIANSQTGCNFSESHYRKAWKTRKLLNDVVNAISDEEVDEMDTNSIGFEAARTYVADEDTENGSPEGCAAKEKVSKEYPTWLDDMTTNATVPAERVERIQRCATYNTDISNAAQAIRQDVRFERFYRTIGTKLYRLGNPTFLPIPTRGDVDGDYVAEDYVVTIADLHAGAKFESQNNSYSYDEIVSRFTTLQNRLIAMVQTKKIATLNVLSLGDLVQGILRISDVKLNEDTVTDAVVFASRLYANFLRNISKYCNINFYMVCYSNHDQIRPLGTKANQIPAEDIGKIVYAYLTDILAENPRVNIIGDVDRDVLEFDIGRFHCLATHGHLVRDVARFNIDISNRNRTQYDYVFLGHTHSAQEMINAEGDHYNIETLVSGSIVGSDPYADTLFVGSKASASVYGFNHIYGHIETTKIILN